MTSSKIIAVIGGTGKSGNFLVKELLRQDLPIKVLLRHPETFPHKPSSQIELIQGDARDPEAVDRLCRSAHAIVSTLGQPKGEPSIFSQAAKNILNAMGSNDIRRYIVTTGLNVDTPQDKKGADTQAGTNWMKEHYPVTTADRQTEYELLCQSPEGIEWTLVRLPMIGLTEESAPIVTSLQDCPGKGIHAVDLARFLVDQLQDRSFIRKAPFLAND
jgi:putative NADH-flavin reductase